MRFKQWMFPLTTTRGPNWVKRLLTSTSYYNTSTTKNWAHSGVCGCFTNATIAAFYKHYYKIWAYSNICEKPL